MIPSVPHKSILHNPIPQYTVNTALKAATPANNLTLMQGTLTLLKTNTHLTTTISTPNTHNAKRPHHRPVL
jgi:hypothetical protein